MTTFSTALHSYKRWFVTFVLLLALPFTILQGCSTKEPVKAIILKLQYRPVPSSFQVGDWKVALSKASLSLRSLRLYEGTPAYSRAPLWPLLISVAHAHPGHGEPGSLKGEMLWEKPLNLLGKDNVSLGEHKGFSGFFGAGELGFDKDSSLQCTGTATKGGKQLSFDWELKLGKHTVYGISLGKNLSDISPPVVYHFDLPAAFKKLGLDSLKPNTDGSVTLKDDSAEANILRKAILNTKQHSLTLSSVR